MQHGEHGEHADENMQHGQHGAQVDENMRIEAHEDRRDIRRQRAVDVRELARLSRYRGEFIRDAAANGPYKDG